VIVKADISFRLGQLSSDFIFLGSVVPAMFSKRVALYQARASTC
jgi:hypothetical protein